MSEFGPITCVGTPAFFGPRCGNEASYRSPTGPLCASCAERSMDAIRKGGTLLNVLAAARGIGIEELLSKYVRIRPEEGGPDGGKT